MRLERLGTLGACMLMLAGCQGWIDGSVGETAAPAFERVGLRLTIADPSVARVLFTITRQDGFRREGAIPLGPDGSGFSAYFALPPAPRYRVDLEALTTGDATCTGSSNFDVELGHDTTVVVRLHCPADDNTGGVTLQGQLNTCPAIDSLVAMPQRAPLGTSVALSAVASDVDPLSYRWSATAGALQAAGAQAVLVCTTPGTAIVSVLASDGDPACSSMSTGAIAIDCFDPSTDVIDAGFAPTASGTSGIGADAASGAASSSSAGSSGEAATDADAGTSSSSDSSGSEASLDAAVGDPDRDGSL